MQQAQNLSNLENLMQGCIQILDHMKTDEDSTDSTVTQVKQMLESEYQNIANLSSSGNQERGEQNRQMIASMQQKIKQAEQLLEPLNNHFYNQYDQKTGGEPAEFETQSISEQKEQSDVYHAKIDNQSTQKLLENLNAMNSVLLDISASIESQIQMSSDQQSAQEGSHYSVAAQFNQDDTTPPTLSP